MKISYINPPVFDYLSSTLIEGLKDLGHEVISLNESNYGSKIARKKFIKATNSSDLLIIGSGAFICYNILKDIFHDKVVYIDGSDYPEIYLPNGIKINLVFKRELLRISDFAENKLIFPLPFGAEKRYFQESKLNKDIDVSFISSLNNYMRRSAHQALSKKFKGRSYIEGTGERAYDGIAKKPLPTPNYYNLLQRSFTSINIPGYGWDCARYWEIIANRTCLITQRLEIKIPYPFIENEHFLAFSNIEEMVEKIDFALSRRNLIKEIVENAYDHLVQHHTATRRAEYLLEQINLNYKKDTFIEGLLNKNEIWNSNLFTNKLAISFISKTKPIINKFLKIN